mmetsp:Transcript_90336/g.165737  ORF Transcript_90336/g.165737 Transcript_90336/m.165737 type:complete len:321 (-) Transcript_90336:142-1104(-)
METLSDDLPSHHTEEEVDSFPNPRNFASGASDESCPDCPEINEEELEWHEHVGEGHTSVVFRGSYKSKPVAIKQMVIPAQTKVMEEVLAREVAIMCLVRHPNIVSLLGVVMNTEPLQIVMEYCEGGSVFNLLHEALDFELTWEQMMQMCTQTATAMNYLHKFDPCIIHRDLKSLNMLLQTPVCSSTDAPLVKVADMGLARALTGGEEALTLGVGTNRWMAPEMLGRMGYNEKIDVYSYGMVLYEVCCRKIPFKGANTMDIRSLVLSGARPPLSEVSPKCPAGMGDLITLCWAQIPSRRPTFEDILVLLVRLKKEVGVVSI